MELFNDLSASSEALIPLLVEHGLNLLGAIIILVAGFIVAGWIAKKVTKSATKAEKFDDTLVPVFAQTARILVLVFTLVIVLGQFGVQTASLVAVLGAAGLAIGFALQGTLSNIASGIVLLILRPFKVGDAVKIGGTLGVVDEIGLFTTEMHSFDNIGITIPNSRVWGDEIQNLSRFDTRRVDLEYGISYDDSMDDAIALIKKILDEDDRVLEEPSPLIAISEHADSFVGIIVRPWAKTSDLWPLRYDINKRVKEAFDANGISIPFPQRDVHIHDQK